MSKSENKQAQLDLIRCAVHLTVDDKNMSKNRDWGVKLRSKLKAALWQNTDKNAGAVKIM